MSARWVVFKFGGTSVASPRALRRAAAVVASAARVQRVAVVVSALAGVTSALEAAAARAARGEAVASAVVGQLRRRHRKLWHVVAPADARTAARALEPVLASLREQLEHATRTRSLTSAQRAQVLATGERLSVLVFAALLRSRGLPAAASDATQWLVAHGEPLEAEPDGAATRERTAQALRTAPALPVITGFLAGTSVVASGPGGATLTAATVLLGRGGSDLSATLLAAALGAERVEIFTDTPGVLTADPRLEPRARVHRTLSPVLASRLARLGAKVLHPRTLEPLLAAGIPLHVRDTFDLSAPGTTIAARGAPPALHAGLDGRATPARHARVHASVVSGPALVRVASDAGVEAPRLAAVLRAHGIPALLSPLDDSLLVPASAVACVRATRLSGLRFAPGPLAARLVAVVSARHALSSERAGRALATAGVFPLAPPAHVLPGVTAAVVADTDVPAATRALHAIAVGGTRPYVDVIVAGARGRVGRALLARLARTRVPGAPRLRLVAAFDTRGALADPTGLDPRLVERQLEHAAPRPLAALVRELHTARTPLVFVDCTASETLAARHAGLLERGIGVVTANKHGMAGALHDWRRLVHAARRAPLRAATTVGAGLPVLSTVRALTRRGDALVSLRATLSGTLSYVLAAAHRGLPLSQAVAEARALGYTEPNPAADLSGADVARKLVIALRAAGIAIEPQAVHVEPWVSDDALRAADAVALERALIPLDAGFAARVAAAHAAGKRLVYAASYDGQHARAGLLEVDEHDALARARPGENVVRLRTALHERVPLVIAGPGAGVAVTAAGVHGDLLSAARALLVRARVANRDPGRGGATAGAAGARHHPAWA